MNINMRINMKMDINVTMKMTMNMMLQMGTRRCRFTRVVSDQSKPRGGKGPLLHDASKYLRVE
jgi:hypothetical protein